MANSPSAIKRIRQNHARRAHNRTRRTRVRTAVKQVRAAIESGDVATVEQLLPKTLSMLDAGANKRVLHSNAAARTKSRLTRAAARLAERSS